MVRIRGPVIGPGQKQHGRYIFAYCNIRTKQVVYSFTHTLNNHDSLKQLPDLGANNKPAVLRKDQWRPLYTVVLPNDSNGVAQGLDAFRRLREYRLLREVAWKPPAALSRNYTKEEIEELQDRLDNRGGSKRETVYDIIKREKKKLRVKIVQNQKANSIADLAAILIEQDEEGAKRAAAIQEMLRRDREAEVQTMLKMAVEADRGGLERLDQEIEQLKLQREKNKQTVEARDGPSNRRLRKVILGKEVQRNKMIFAANAVKRAPFVRIREMEAKTQRLIAAHKAVEEDVRKHVLKIRQITKPEVAPFEGRNALHKETSGQKLRSEGQSDSNARKAGMSQSKHLDEQLKAGQSSLMQLRGGEESQEATFEELKKKADIYKAALKEHRALFAAQIEEADEKAQELHAHGQTLARSEQDSDTTGDKLLNSELETDPQPATQTTLRSNTQEKNDIAGDEVPNGELETDPQPATLTKPCDIDWYARLPSFPTPYHAGQLPRRGARRRHLLAVQKPIFSASGITVRWDDPLDAEFAQAWPELVLHEPMGLKLHTAPRAEPVHTVPMTAHDLAEDQLRQKLARLQARMAELQAKGERQLVVKDLAMRVIGAVREAERQRPGGASPPSATNISVRSQSQSLTRKIEILNRKINYYQNKLEATTKAEDANGEEVLEPDSAAEVTLPTDGDEAVLKPAGTEEGVKEEPVVAEASEPVERDGTAGQNDMRRGSANAHAEPRKSQRPRPQSYEEKRQKKQQRMLKKYPGWQIPERPPRTEARHES